MGIMEGQSVLLVFLEVTHLQTSGNPGEPCHVQKMSECCQQVATSCLSGCSQRSTPLDLDDENPLLPVRTRPQFPTLQNQAAILFQPALYFASLLHTVRALVTTHILLPVILSYLKEPPPKKRGREKSFLLRIILQRSSTLILSIIVVG